MRRRDFLKGSGQGIAWLGVATLGACRSSATCGGEAGFDPGDYVTGSEHLIFDEAGAAYVLDPDAHRVHALGAGGKVGATMGELGSALGELNRPVDAALGAGGELYVLDRGNGRIQVFDADGSVLRSIGRPGKGAGELDCPNDFVLHDGRLYVCDTLNHRVVVFDAQGTQVAVFGASDGQRPLLNGPSGIAIAGNGELHVLDGGDAEVEVYGPAGEALRRYGGHGTEPGRMLAPRSIAIHEERVFIADASSGFVHVYATSGAFLGRFRPCDEAGAAVPPMRVSIMPSGTLYVWTAGLEAHPS